MGPIDHIEGTRTFGAGGAAYDRFMGRYSEQLAPAFADFAGIGAGTRVLDVGAGPGALAAVAVDRVGAARVSALDPTDAFVQVCRARLPEVQVRQGPAEQIPFEDAAFDVAAAQLVFHFLSDPARAAAEMIRVVRPGGVIATCVWDFAEGMQMLRAFWDAALDLDAEAPDEARVMRFGREGELTEVLSAGGLGEVTETTLQVTSVYADFDELWEGFLGGIGPAGAYCLSLPQDRREALRERLFEVVGHPRGSLSMSALARAARGTRA